MVGLECPGHPGFAAISMTLTAEISCKLILYPPMAVFSSFFNGPCLLRCCVVSATIVAVSHPSNVSWNFATSESAGRFWNFANSRWMKTRRFHCLDRVGLWNYEHKAKSPVGSTASFQGNSFESIARRTRSCPERQLSLSWSSSAIYKKNEKQKKKQYISRSKHPNCLLGSL